MYIKAMSNNMSCKLSRKNRIIFEWTFLIYIHALPFPVFDYEFLFVELSNNDGAKYSVNASSNATVQSIKESAWCILLQSKVRLSNRCFLKIYYDSLYMHPDMHTRKLNVLTGNRSYKTAPSINSHFFIQVRFLAFMTMHNLDLCFSILF